MDEFDGASTADHIDRRCSPGGVEHRGGSHGKARPYPFSAGLDQVTGDFGEEFAVGRHNPQKLVFGAVEVGFHRRKNRKRLGSHPPTLCGSCTRRLSLPIGTLIIGTDGYHRALRRLQG